MRVGIYGRECTMVRHQTSSRPTYSTYHTCACLRAPTSLAPSPHIMQVLPEFLRASTSVSFSSGVILANTWKNTKRFIQAEARRTLTMQHRKPREGSADGPVSRQRSPKSEVISAREIGCDPLPQPHSTPRVPHGWVKGIYVWPK